MFTVKESEMLFLVVSCAFIQKGVYLMKLVGLVGEVKSGEKLCLVAFL